MQQNGNRPLIDAASVAALGATALIVSLVGGGIAWSIGATILLVIACITYHKHRAKQGDNRAEPTIA